MSISIRPILSKMTCARENFPTVVVDMLYDFADPIRLSYEISKLFGVTCLVPHLSCNAISGTTKLWVEVNKDQEIHFCTTNGLREASYQSIGGLEYVTLQEMQWPVWMTETDPLPELQRKNKDIVSKLLAVRTSGKRDGSILVELHHGVGIKAYRLDCGCRKLLGEFVFDGLDYEYKAG